MKNITRNVAILACIATLSACGGGGGESSGSNPSSGNNPSVPVVQVPAPDTTAPVLASNANIFPINGADSVAPDATVSFNMSENLSSAQVVMVCNQQPVSGTTKVEGSAVTFKANKILKPSAECNATVIAAGTKDTVGNQLVANTTVTNFKVKALACPSNLPNNPAPSFNGTQTIAICNNIYVDPAVNAEDHFSIISAVEDANKKITNFFGSQLAQSPDVIICNSNACVNYFSGYADQNVTIYAGGKSGQYVAPRNTIVIVYPIDINLTAVPHEFTHVEIAARTNGVLVNAWFNEGIATYIAGQPACPAVSPKGIDDLKKLDEQAAWNTYITQQASVGLGVNTYCQARNEVATWIDRNGKDNAVQVITKLGQGQDFYSMYGALLTQ